MRPEEDPQVLHYHYVAQRMRLSKHRGLAAIADRALNERLDEIMEKREMSNLEKFAAVLPDEARITNLFADLRDARKDSNYKLMRLKRSQLNHALRELAQRVSQ